LYVRHLLCQTCVRCATDGECVDVVQRSSASTAMRRRDEARAVRREPPALRLTSADCYSVRSLSQAQGL